MSFRRHARSEPQAGALLSRVEDSLWASAARERMPESQAPAGSGFGARGSDARASGDRERGLEPRQVPSFSAWSVNNLSIVPPVH